MKNGLFISKNFFSYRKTQLAIPGTATFLPCTTFKFLTAGSHVQKQNIIDGRWN